MTKIKPLPGAAVYVQDNGTLRFENWNVLHTLAPETDLAREIVDYLQELLTEQRRVYGPPTLFAAPHAGDYEA